MRQGLSCVGTVKKDRHFTPEPLRHHSKSKDKLYVSRFSFQEKATMVYYKPKKKQSCNTPEYSALCQQVHKYSCKRDSQRWPMAYTFSCLDTHAIFKTKFPSHPLSGKDSRSHFIKSGASHLAQAQLLLGGRKSQHRPIL